MEYLVVTFFALSLGTSDPQLLHETVPAFPLPPLERPRLFLFFDISNFSRSFFPFKSLLWKEVKRVGLSCPDYSRLYGVPRAFGKRDLPIAVATTMRVTMYGTIEKM
jgi:hypothetical protein